MKRLISVMAMLLVIVSWSANSGATVIFSNLSEENAGVFSSGGFGITGTGKVGYKFSIFGEYTLDRVSIALANMSSILGSGASDVNLEFGLVRDLGGYPDFLGTLETFDFFIPESQVINPILLSCASGLNPLVSSGDYWLVGSLTYPQGDLSTGWKA